ncbi:MAG: aldehyde dehydrogenase family protein [Proteobacteria bacterium]|nr:aldehyde dehydrogenase family protein [Pseudomonadota bacterium]
MRSIFMEYNKTVERLSGSIFIGGELQKVNNREQMQVHNPATMKIIGHIPACEEQEVEAAAASAAAAKAPWANTPAAKRGGLLQACARIISDHAEELAMIMSYETGKALRTESRVELGVVGDIFSFYGGLALELKGDTIPFSPDMLTFTLREPIGVVGAIIPWNVPLMLMATKVAPALAAGNTVVLKPSPEATFCVLRAVELLHKILPAGVLNVITGGAASGSSLVAHPHVEKIAFTGSVDTGRKVYQTAANKIIPVTLELGGKSPMIICADADLDLAVKSVFEGMRFTRQGQSCSASSRLLVHADLHDSFVAKLLAHIDTMIMGDPMDEQTDIGTIISERQFDTVQSFLKIAEADPDLKVHYATKMPTEAHLARGLFTRPAIITGLHNDHVICQKEIFGPVAAIVKWREFDEAIQIANSTEFGLAAGIWTRDLPRALQAVKRLEAGFVQVNQYIVFRPSLPFGGYKNSGLGKEASLNSMLEQYTKEKTVIINTALSV